MDKIRLKITIKLNRHHALNARQLDALKSPIEKGIAAALPGEIAVDTIKVTKIAETTSATPLEAAPSESDR